MNTLSRYQRMTAGALAALGLFGGSLAAQTRSTGSSAEDSSISEIVRQAVDRYCQGSQAPQTATPPAIDRAARPTVPLRLDDAVQYALDRNLDIVVQRLNPQTFDFTIAGLQATYRPAFTSQVASQGQVTPPTSQLNGGQRVELATQDFNAGFTQNIPWGGGAFTATWNNRRQTTTNLFANYDPAYTTNFTGIYTQPLLRGFSIDSTRQQLVVTKLNRDISEMQLKATITNTVSNVRNAYWDLVFAMQSVEVARRSLALAEKLVEDNKVRVDVGTMAPIDIVQAQAEAAIRRQALVQSESSHRTAELALKRLIVGGTQDPLWNSTLDPVDRPDFKREAIDVEQAVRTALSQRTDIEQAKRSLESNEVTLRFLRNQSLPQADLVARYGLQGLGGTQFIRQGTGLGSTIIGEIPGGFADALSALAGRDFPTWNLSLNISYPIGLSTADAQIARARVQLSQNQAQVRQLELQAATEVTNAALQVQSNLQSVEAAQAARELAQKRLEAEQSKFEVGMSTNFFVVQAQRDLADAQNSELRALLDYRKSLVDYERTQQTALSSAGITLVNAGGLNLSAVGSGRPTTTTGGTGTQER